MGRSFSNSNGPDGCGNSGMTGPYDWKNINGVPLNWIPDIWPLWHGTI